MPYLWINSKNNFSAVSDFCEANNFALYNFVIKLFLRLVFFVLCSICFQNNEPIHTKTLKSRPSMNRCMNDLSTHWSTESWNERGR